MYIDAFLMHRSFQKECRIALTFCKVILYYIVLLFKVLKGQFLHICYFLAGLCTNRNCPYRHVNVNPKASTCEGFLRGYCADGDEVLPDHDSSVVLVIFSDMFFWH